MKERALWREGVTYTGGMLLMQRIKHCRVCGQGCSYVVPPEDNRPRAVCGSCGEIHYENPINVVGTVPVWGDQVLLCKRNIEPRRGFWTLPAGFMELGETTAEGAMRETDEEAGAHIVLDGLFSILNVVRAGQIHFFYRATLQDTQFNPGTETMEVGLFRESEIPWEEIAFRTVRVTLEKYFEDARQGAFAIHTGDIA